jgi:hypothetical protein
MTGACKAAGVTGHRAALASKHAHEDDRAAVLASLREVARELDRPVARRDLPWSLHQALLRHFGDLDTARDAARVRGPAHPAKWSRAKVIAELQREHARGTRLTVRGLEAAERKDLLSAIAVYIGALPRARRLANVPEPIPLPRRSIPFQKEWDEARVTYEIWMLAADPAALAPSKIPRPLYAAGARYFGTWRAAIEAAGLDYHSTLLRRELDDDELLAIVAKLAQQYPHMTLVEARRLPIATSLYRRFGGLEVAGERAGQPGWPRRITHPVMPRARVKSALAARLRQDRSIERVAIAKDDPKLEYAVTRIHPVWSVAIARLGVIAARPSRQIRRRSSRSASSWSGRTARRAISARSRSGRNVLRSTRS